MSLLLGFQILVVGTVPYRFLFANNPFVKKETIRYQIIIRSVSTVAQKRLLVVLGTVSQFAVFRVTITRKILAQQAFA